MSRVLIIEDEMDIAQLLQAQLSILDLESDIVHHGLEAIETIKESADLYDLFIIDRMLPGMNGVEICKFLREQNNSSPIMMVTALAQSENIVEGLDAGADDYITKPFDMDVLLARVRAQLRRKSQILNPELIELDSLSINLKECSVKIDNNDLALTHTEFQILSLLSQDAGRVFTREQLIKKIIGDNVHVTQRTIDTHVAGLRKKLGTYSKNIKTIRGIGYRFYLGENI